MLLLKIRFDLYGIFVFFEKGCLKLPLLGCGLVSTFAANADTVTGKTVKLLRFGLAEIHLSNQF